MSHWLVTLLAATGFAGALLFGRQAVFGDEGAASSPARVAPPGLIRGVMTDDIKTLKELGANSCLLWGLPAKPEAWDNFARAGQFVFLNDLGGPKKEFFEYEGKKRVKMLMPFCYGGKWGQWWSEHIATAAPKNLPAICNLTTDECAWNNADIAYVFGIRQPTGAKFYCDCEDCRKGAGELPEITASRFLADSPAARKYINYRYKALADAIKAAQDQARKADPAFLSYYVLNLREVYALERYQYGVALDMLPQADVLLATAFQTSVDRRGDDTRFLHAITAKYLLAARPRIGAVPALAATVYDYKEKFDWTEAYCWRKDVEDMLPKPILDSIAKDMTPYKLRDDEVILPALSCLAHGAKGVMFFGDERKEALKKLFSLMAVLEKPLAGATVPPDVVVLVSRQSEDEWMLSHAPKATSREDLSDAITTLGCWAQPANRVAWEYNKAAPHSEGFRASQALMKGLMQLGIPFRVYFVEDLQASDLADAKVVMLPFVTHIADAKAVILKKASAKAKVFAFVHAGEFDERGAKRDKPALQEQGMLVLKPGPEQAMKDAGGRQDLLKIIGYEPEFRLSIDGEAVEHTWLRLAGGETASFIINWGQAPAKVKAEIGKATVWDTAGNSLRADSVTSIDVPGRDARIIIQD
ncbi:MAG: hypothetical protein ACE15C_03310 [Phycisphaerae bacterium]